MGKGIRSRNARLRASFGRAERLNREAGKQTREPAPALPDRAPKTPEHKPSQSPRRYGKKYTLILTPQEAQERLEQAAERRRQLRSKEHTRTVVDHTADRRDQAQRTERDRQRQQGLATVKRVQEQRQREGRKQANLRRVTARQEFNRQAERRQDLDRRADRERQAAQLAERQKELQRRAAAEIEREQKRRGLDQQAAHRRQTDEMRSRHKSEHNSFRANENTAIERHHYAIKGIDEREARELADFDGRRRGLAGRIAEAVPGRRAENDRQRDEMKRGFESERLTKHRDLEALKERQFDREQQHLRDQAGQRKALMELHRDERDAFSRDQAAARPRLIEERAHVIERADRAHEQEREREAPVRENIRPSEDFARAAGDKREPATELDREARAMARAF